MIFEFVPKEPDKAYVSNRLWLPKKLIREGPVKKALEFVVPTGKGGQVKLELWDSSTNHIICPREFLRPSEYPKYKFPFVDLRPSFQKVEFLDLVTPRNPEQERAWQALSLNDNGILNLGCGKGKTKLALKKIAQKRVPTLVIVPDGGILTQWKESIYGNTSKGLPAGLKFDDDLGIVQGQTFDWKRPVTVALVTTLALRIRDEALPEEFFRRWGLVVYDECHQIGAPVFSLTAAPFYGDRIGLTATVQREDGLDPIYRYHIGEPFYSDLKQDLIPRIYFQQTPAVLPWEESKIEDTVNISILRSILGKSEEGNIYRYWCIKEALDEGRKLLCLSHSKPQLRLFHKLFPGSGLLISETDRFERMDILRNSQVCFAIARLGSTGVDDDRLDTLFWLTPFRSKNSLQQSMGRIQRECSGKKTPVMIIFEDWMVPPLRGLCLSLKKSLKDWSYELNTIKPRQFPKELPSELKSKYDKLLISLTQENDNGEPD